MCDILQIVNQYRGSCLVKCQNEFMYILKNYWYLYTYNGCGGCAVFQPFYVCRCNSEYCTHTCEQLKIMKLIKKHWKCSQNQTMHTLNAF